MLLSSGISICPKRLIAEGGFAALGSCFLFLMQEKEFPVLASFAIGLHVQNHAQMACVPAQTHQNPIFIVRPGTPRAVLAGKAARFSLCVASEPPQRMKLFSNFFAKQGVSDSPAERVNFRFDAGEVRQALLEPRPHVA